MGLIRRYALFTRKGCAIPQSDAPDLLSDMPTSTTDYIKGVESDAILDRSGAMADKEEYRKAGRNRKVEQFTARALREFGLQKSTLDAGAYGHELKTCPRRKRRAQREHLRKIKLEVPISNRIARAESSGRFGNITGEWADAVSVTLADCVALDAAR